MRFTKMQGLGNDYVYINAFEEPVAEPEKLAIRLADRHFGVGGDGLILVAPPTAQGRSQGAGVRMRMFNADGSESEMCGNGVRCVAKFAWDQQLCRENPMRVETGRGVLTLALELKADKVSQVSVEMGQPILAASEIPVALGGTAELINEPLTRLDLPRAPWMQTAGMEERFTCVSMGNPHLVIFCRDVAAVDLEQVGPVLERHAAFPRRINVHFVQVHSAGEVTMRTWERGSGITLACGTGASAVCVAGLLTGHSAASIVAHLPGGDLRLEWAGRGHPVIMTGPATEVFRGEI